MSDEFCGVIDYTGEDSIVFYERAVLGSLLLEPNRLVDIDLSGAEFTVEANRLIFGALRAMEELSIPVDVITVSQHLESRGLGAVTGGLPYLGALTQVPPAPKNVVFYAKSLLDRGIAHSRALDLAKISGQLGQASKGVAEVPGFDLKSHIEDVERNLDKIKGSAETRITLRHVREASADAVEAVEARFANDGKLSGLSTGFPDLDEKLCGLQPGDLIIVAGRPSMGKTALAVNIAENIAESVEKPVGVVCSLEMPSLQLAARMISSLGRIRSESLRSGLLTDPDFDRLTMACVKINSMKLYIDDRSTAGVADIKSIVRKVVAKEGRVDFLVIDYLQLMSEPGMSRSENRSDEISVISRGLKAIAKEFNIPVVALSQLNRSLEKRQDKRPMISDLRESGALEQDADVILFVYRDEVYNPETAEPGIAEIIIGKQRNGPVGTVLVNFEGEFSKFSSRLKAY